MYPAGVVRSNLTKEDISEVAWLQSKVMPNPWSEQAFNSSIKAGNGCYTLIKAEEIVAVAVVVQVLDEAELLTIAVAKHQQGQGLGAELLADLMSVLKAQSAKQCMLEVMEGNDAAISLYQRIGFKSVAKRKAYYKTEQGIFDALVMRIDY
ncbi:MAG: ribosomal-protein-alanine N-acetyltransferase [Pseudomonadales bacterium]|jgi:ribosomal-protein-alanine N-acetyltransferase